MHPPLPSLIPPWVGGAEWGWLAVARRVWEGGRRLLVIFWGIEDFPGCLCV